MSGLTFQDDLHVMNKRGDNYINFQAVRSDMGSVVNKTFNAWLTITGDYIIMERDASDSDDITIKYFHSKDSENAGVFATDWAARSTLTYKEYNELFT